MTRESEAAELDHARSVPDLCPGFTSSGCEDRPLGLTSPARTASCTADAGVRSWPASLEQADIQSQFGLCPRGRQDPIDIAGPKICRRPELC